MIVLETLYRLIDLLYTMVLLLIFCETLTIRKNKILQILALCLLWFIGTVPIYSHDVRSVIIALVEFIVFLAIFFNDGWVKKVLMLSFFYPFIVSINYLMINFSERIFYAVTSVERTADWTQEVILIDKSIICSFSFVRLLLGIGFYLYLRRYLREISEMMPDKIWKVLATILIMPLSSILGIVYFFPEGTVFLYPICIVTIITEFACIYLSAYICRKIVYENEARELRMKQVFYEERLKEEDRIRSIYHDLKNHLLILQSRVTNGEETQEMIQSLQKQISDYENYVETGNSFLDVIFRDKMKMAKEKNIDFHSEIDFSKGDFLDGLSVSTIFGNALDNAIEACEKISEEERFITVRGSVEQSFLAIQIENAACQNDYGQSVNTTKSDKFLHGFGKQNIQRAVEKYDGNVAWGYKDGIYTLSILIPLAK